MKDRQLFEQLLEKYHDDVFRVALYYTKSQDDASDVTQETFLRAMKYFYSYRQDTDFKAWILSILRNVFFSFQKKKKQSVHIENGLEFIPDTSSSTDQTIMNKIEINIVREAIEKLPVKFREVIVLSDIESLSYEAIAEVLLIPVGTVRSRLHRARLLLKERILNTK